MSATLTILARHLDNSAVTTSHHKARPGYTARQQKTPHTTPTKRARPCWCSRCRIILATSLVCPAPIARHHLVLVASVPQNAGTRMQATPSPREGELGSLLVFQTGS